MGLFSKKPTILSSGVFEGFTDYHSHILPGVDDGIRSMEDALAVLNFYESIGVKTVWCTPHIMEDFPNTPEALKQRFAQLKEAYNGPIELHLAAEHMLDGLFEERLPKGEVLPMNFDGWDCLLVETSYFQPPSNMDDMLRSVFSAGFYPILAHPERYVYMEKKDYKRLAGMGVRLQLNVTSLGGCYGPDAKNKAEWLLKNGMYSIMGTDIHSLHSFRERINAKTSCLKCK